MYCLISISNGIPGKMNIQSLKDFMLALLFAFSWIENFSVCVQTQDLNNSQGSLIIEVLRRQEDIQTFLL